MEGKEVLSGMLVGDQANGTQQAKEEFGFSRLCIRGVHGLMQICWVLVPVASQVPVRSTGTLGISQKLGDGAGGGQRSWVLPHL